MRAEWPAKVLGLLGLPEAAVPLSGGGVAEQSRLAA